MIIFDIIDLRSCMNTIFSNIYEKDYKTLTKSEKICLDYMSKIGPRLLTISIHDLASEINISTATIQRLIAKLGYKSFKEFKNSFAVNYEKPLLSDFDNHLIELINNFNPELVHEFCDYIKNCSGHIYIFAFGATMGTAYDLIIGLKKFGYQASLVSESDLFIPTVSEVYKSDDLIIYISFSGNNERLSNVASILYKKVTQIYISANPRGTIGTYTQLNLTADFYTPKYEVRARAPLNIIVAKLLLHLHKITDRN